MVAKGDQYHRLRVRAQLVHQLGKLCIGLEYGVQVVVHRVPAFQAVVLGEVLRGTGIPGGVGAVALDIDRKGEVGFPGLLVLLEIAVDLRQEDRILRVSGLGALLKIPLQETVMCKPHIPVDVLAIIEPLEIGVAALHRVALIPQVGAALFV